MAAWLGACASGGAPDTAVDPQRVLDPQVRAYLVEPGVGMEDVPATRRDAAVGVYRTLLDGDLNAARDALATLGGDRSLQRLLEAQIAFASGDLAAARAALGGDPPGDAGLLLSGRLHDLAGEPVPAVQAFWPLRERYGVAGDRLTELLSEAISARQSDFDDALVSADPQRATQSLADLERWAPEREATRRAAVRLARLTRNPEAELDAWRRLARLAPPTRDELFTWAELELTHGSADQALEVARALAAGGENDDRAHELLARAEFVWRSRLLPDRARQVLSSQALTRGELAVALYWFFPQARYAPSQQVTIASDILDHPYREEIAQIVNAGLLDVDPAGHRFRPDVVAMRSDALQAVVEVLRGGGLACAQAGRTCEVMVACEVLAQDQCSAGAGVSGDEFGYWARRAQERLTRP